MYSKTSFIALLSTSLCLSFCLTAFSIPAPAHANELTLNPAQVSSLGIKLEPVRVATQEAVAIIPGLIIPSMNGRKAVVAPFSGTVVSVLVLPGQRVKTGDLMMKIASREILEEQSNLKQAEAELDATKAVAKRYRNLANKKISAISRALEAEAQVTHAAAKVSSLNQILNMGNIKANTDGSYSLVATSSGRIVKIKAVPGTNISAMAPAIVMDISDVTWVEAQLPGSYISDVNKGDALKVHSIDGKRIASGKVLSVGHSLDSMNRSAKLIGELSSGASFISGELVNVSVVRAARLGGLEVPSSSVVFIEGKPKIFVRTNKGFLVAPVRLRGRSIDVATIEAKIAVGQQVAISGLASLENMMAGE